MASFVGRCQRSKERELESQRTCSTDEEIKVAMCSVLTIKAHSVFLFRSNNGRAGIFYAEIL